MVLKNGLFVARGEGFISPIQVQKPTKKVTWGLIEGNRVIDKTQDLARKQRWEENCLGRVEIVS